VIGCSTQEVNRNDLEVPEFTRYILILNKVTEDFSEPKYSNRILVNGTDFRGQQACLFGIEICSEENICGEINRRIQHNFEFCQILQLICSEVWCCVTGWVVPNGPKEFTAFNISGEAVYLKLWKPLTRWCSDTSRTTGILIIIVLWSLICAVFIFRYADYREPPDGANKYEKTAMYWHILAARLAFVVVFEVSFGVRNLMWFQM